MTNRRTINEAIGYLQHFKADALSGLPCDPDTVQMAIDRLQAAIAEPAPARPFQHVASICAGDVALTGADFRGETPVFAVGVRQDPTKHASTSPGPVNCSTRLRFQNQRYPRTCARCGLGPCPFFLDDGSAKP
ncbi:hypothetical protein ATY75_12000 [Rhizobium sp. N122]|nr:hypothetical protein ATY75_12000 [Rhizobium sp. N122]